jgi:hypothetical protein
MPNINTLDVRVQKSFQLGGKRRMQFQLNTYNLLNANTVTAMDFRAGPNFKRPTAILSPRNVEYSFSYLF